MRTNSPSNATANNTRSEPSPAMPSELQQTVASPSSPMEMKITQTEYGKTKSGVPVTQYVCTNIHGYVLELIDLGASITALRAPDRDGNLANVTLGCHDLDGYETQGACLGAMIGRFANRIAGAKFVLNNHEYKLAANSGEHHIHGGRIGFNKHVWRSEPIERDDAVGARFFLTSSDGEEGYPGNIEVQVDYTLNNDNELRMEYTAVADQPTPINLTNHAYWNLGGATSGKVDGHQVTIDADKILSVDKDSIPIEEVEVAETPFDFREPKTIGSRMDQIGNQPLGYDHCYVLKQPLAGDADANSEGVAAVDANRLKPSEPTAWAAIVTEPKSGRTMKLFTNQPGMQFYTGNYLNGQPGSGGFEQHQGFCFETQAYPNAVNRSDFPSAILNPGETYRHVTILKFSVE